MRSLWTDAWPECVYAPYCKAVERWSGKRGFGCYLDVLEIGCLERHFLETEYNSRANRRYYSKYRSIFILVAIQEVMVKRAPFRIEMLGVGLTTIEEFLDDSVTINSYNQPSCSSPVPPSLRPLSSTSTR